MFKLIAFLFLVTNGVTAEQPSGSLKASVTFPTEEACMNYFDTDAGRASQLKLEEFMAAQSVTAKFKCIKIEGESM
jgi:hypothetical protein